MCPTPRTRIFKRIAASQSAPQPVRDAATLRLNQTNVQLSVTNAPVHTPAPTSGSKDFTATIYSMTNKDYADETNHDEDGRPVSNWANTIRLPGILIKDTTGYLATNADGSPISDPCLDLTYNGFETVYNFFKTCFNRNSIDNAGLELRGAIHLSVGYDNAFWESEKRSMFFGDGGRSDGKDWLPPDPTIPDAKDLTNWHAPYSLDILGHELTHGVVQHTAKLGAKQNEQLNKHTDKSDATKAAVAEAGTLDEHFADCFGIMVRQFSKGEDAHSSDWDMAPEWYSKIAMDAMGWDKAYMRTFRVPEDKKKQADQSPKHMSELMPWVDKDGDPEDPHTNIGVLNHVFYLAAQGFGGKTWENVGRVWYAALTDERLVVPENQTFRGLKELTVDHAFVLFGADGKQFVVKAWEDVGL